MTATDSYGSVVAPLDIYDDGFLGCPHPRLAEARRACPVLPLTREGWWIVTRDEDVRRVLRDTETFSSAVHRHSPPPPEVADAVAAVRAKGWPYTNALGTNDAPVHTRYRRLVNKVFTARSLTWMEPLLEATVEELAAALPHDVEIDFMSFAGALPIWAISRILGLPDEMRDDVRRWTAASTASIGARPSAADWVRHEQDLLDYQLTIAAELDKGGSGGEGLIYRLAQAAADEQDLAEDQQPLGTGVLLTLIREMVVAGNETTGKAIAEGVRMFGADPQVWERIRAEPEYADRLAEESLRLASPSQSAMRRVTRDVTLGETLLPAGSHVVVSLVSANRDEALYAEPDEFDGERANARRHLAFGLGPHACVGAALARMEMTLCFRALARHVRAIRPAATEVPYTRSFMLRGPLEFRVRVDRRDGRGHA